MASIQKCGTKRTSTHKRFVLTFLVFLGLTALLPSVSIQAKALFAPNLSVSGNALGGGNVSFTITNSGDTAATDFTWELYVDDVYNSNATFSLAAGNSINPSFSSVYGNIRLDVKNNGGTVIASDTVFSPANTPLPTNTFTNTPTVTNTSTATNTSSVTNTPTETFTPSLTFTPSETFTPSFTFTPSNTPTNTFAPSNTAVPTHTYTPSITNTYTYTYTPSYTFTSTFTISPTPSATTHSISPAKNTETNIPYGVFVYPKTVTSITPTKSTITATETATPVLTSGSPVAAVAQIITSTTTKTIIIPITSENPQQGTSQSLPFWLWIVIGSVLIVMTVFFIFMRRKKLQDTLSSSEQS